MSNFKIKNMSKDILAAKKMLKEFKRVMRPLTTEWSRLHNHLGYVEDSTEEELIRAMSRLEKVFDSVDKINGFSY